MPIADLQRRDTEVGRIRLGVKKGGRADRLDTLRFSSSDQAMIEEIAAEYGGTPEPWMNGKRQQYQVITEASVIPVYIPPQNVDPWYEAWGNGVCQRRCDGIRDLIHDRPCDCSVASNGKRSNCKPTTRVNLYLAEIPGMGVWRLETHGIYAAGELVQLSERINGIKVPLPARLMLEQRGAKKFNRETGKIDTLEYNVPVLLLDSITSRHIALGEDAVSQVVRAAAAQQVEAPPAAPALPAAPAPAPAGPPQPDQALIDRALAMIATATADQMADVRQRIAKTGDPQVLVQAFQARLGELEVERQQRAQQFEGAWDADEAADERRQASEAPAAAPAAPPAQAQAPAETPPALPSAPAATENTSGDRQAAMTRLLGVGGAKGLNRKQLDERMQSDHEVTLKQATAAQLDALAAAL